MVKIYTTIKKTAYLLVFLLLISIFSNKLYAQAIQGKEFWLTMPQDDALVSGGPTNLTPYYLFIIGFYDCTVTIQYPNRAGGPLATQTVAITGGQRTIVKLSTIYVDPVTASERVGKNGIKVTSTELVAVSAIYYDNATSEICPIYPIELIGKEYLSIAYREQWAPNPDPLLYVPFVSRINLVATEDNTTVNFTMPLNAWASTDGGVVTRGPGDTWSTVMNRGESYTIICSLNGPTIDGDTPAPANYVKQKSANFPPWYFRRGAGANPSQDNPVNGNNIGLTSVSIIADKNIAVFGGTAGTNIGSNEYPTSNFLSVQGAGGLAGCGAADLTYSQQLPINKWGTKHTTTNTLNRQRSTSKNNNPNEPGNPPPPAPAASPNSSIADYLMIMSNDNNNMVSIIGNNIPVGTPATKTLNKGEIWFFQSNSAGNVTTNITNPGSADHVITSTLPVQVAQFQKGWQCDAVNQTANNKDPGQMTVLDERLWRYKYIVTNPTDPANGVAYSDNFLVLITNETVTPRATISLSLNNVVTPLNNWVLIPNTTYYTLRLGALVNGVTIRAQSSGVTPFAFYVSGAGGAGSYGYMGGATCDMQAFGGLDSTKHLKGTKINVCNSDTAFFRIDSVKNGVIVRPALHPSYTDPSFIWYLDTNRNGNFKDPNDIVINSRTIPRASFIFQKAGNYNILVEVIDVAGCFDTDTFQVVISSDIPKPTIVGPNAVCEGDSVQLTASSSLAIGRFVWTDPYTNARTFGKDNSILKGKPSSPLMPYLVKYVTPKCASADTFFNVQLLTGVSLPAPLVTGDREICNGETTALQVVSGNGIYEMYLDPMDAVPAETNVTGEFIFSGLPVGTNYRYFKFITLTPAGIRSCETLLAKDSIVVYPFPTPPTISSNRPICQGDKATLTASGSGTNASYNWFAANMGGSSLSNTSTYITPNLNTTTTYYAESRANGCTSPRSPHTVDVTPTPLQPTVVNDTICAGNSGRLEATNIETTAILTWYADLALTKIAKAASSQTIFNTPVLDGSEPEVVYYVQSEVNGCKSPLSTGSIKVTKLPIITSVTPTATCSNQPNLSLDVFPGNDDINDIKYSYEFFDANKQPLPGGGSPSDPNFSSTYDVTPGPNSNSTYYIVLTDLATACPSDTFEHKVTVNPSPIVNSFTLPVCVGNTASLVPSPDPSGVYNYFWYKNLTGGGAAVSQAVPFNIPNIQRDTVFYLLARHKTNLCQNNPRVKITVDAITVPVVTNVTGNVVCEGRDANLVATSSSDPNVIYNWYENDLPGVGPELNTNPNSSRFRVDKSRVADGKKFYVEAVENSPAACKSPRREIPLTVVPATLEAVAIGCYDTLYADKLTVEWAAVQGAGSYELSRDNFTTTVNIQAVFGQSDYQYTFNNLAYGQSYSVSIRAVPPANLQNCASPSQVSTIVCSTLPCGDSLIMFTDRIINLAIPGDHIDTVGVRDITGIAPYTINTVSIDYAWSPLVGGNGPGPHLQKPTTTTIYNVTATFFRDRNSSRDFSGCPQLYGKMKITVLDPDFKPTFFIPNAFSPNDDINNNSLIPVVVGAIDYNLSIYDRWGGRVFEATDTNQNWNGKVGNSGADAPQGVYVYIAKLKSGKNVTTTYKGTITVTK